MSDSTRQIVTIDGPAGVGKSTVSRGLAHILGFTYLDTGAMYRAIAYGCHSRGCDVSNGDDVAQLLPAFLISLRAPDKPDDDVRVYLNNKEISAFIRTPEMGSLASQVSAHGPVRSLLTSLQQEIGCKGKIVAEGRDTGTVVFPYAAWKFYLDATPENRAQRRVKQLRGNGQEADEQHILAMIKQRDTDDKERSLAPLKPAQDAVYIDSTTMTAEQVITLMLSYISL